MHIRLLHPAVTYDGYLSGAQFHHLCAIVMFEPVVDREAAPGDSLGVGLLVDIQPAFAAVRMERIVLANYNLRFAISVYISNADGVRGTNSVNKVHVKHPIPRADRKSTRLNS